MSAGDPYGLRTGCLTWLALLVLLLSCCGSSVVSLAQHWLTSR